MTSNDDLEDEIVREFLIESLENLDQLDQDLIALEQRPGSRDLLASIFRTIHTIKGTSGFLAFSKLETVTHAAESLLAKLRDGLFDLTPDITDALLRVVDAVRGLLAHIEFDRSEGDAEVTQLAAELKALLEAKVGAAKTGAPAGRTRDGGPGGSAPAPAPVLVPAPAVTGEPDVEADRSGQPDALTAQPPLAVPAEPRSAIGDSSIRVDVELLEQLVRLAGELVLARNQILQRAATVQDEELGRACHRLNQIASELQEGVMRTRMQPIEHVWSKLPRVVRDLGAQLNRNVRLEMEGGETELDRTLLEAVKDPLTHLVRNAIDHGIESPQQRRAAGKSETGVLKLRAAHEGGQVVVEVCDDGRGIDAAVIGRKAVEKGLVSEDRLASMTDNEILHLLFVPGFSTAAVVTNVSGRGVGMDVVRTNIERIGGSVDVESRPGHGTVWRLRIPLTLAIVPAITVLCAGQRFAVPQVNLLELVSLDGERTTSRTERVGDAEVYRLRGRLLPLVRLDHALAIRRNGQSVDTSSVIAVLEADGRRFGLLVDKVLDTEEIVVKPVSGIMKELGLYSGATILGDGAVSLILDVQNIARRYLRSGESVDSQVADVAVADVADSRQLLIVRIGANRRVAVPLEVVTRLEEFPVADIEQVGRRQVVRYRGGILPLIRLSEHLNAGYGEARDVVPGVVYSLNGRSVALAAEEIIDIVSEASVTRSDLDDFGLVGSAVIRDRVTELLDVRTAILAADPMFYDDRSGHGINRAIPDSQGAWA